MYLLKFSPQTFVWSIMLFLHLSGLTLCSVPFCLLTTHHISDEKGKWKESFSYLCFCLGWRGFFMSFFGHFTPVKEKNKMNFPSLQSSTAKLETSLICQFLCKRSSSPNPKTILPKPSKLIATESNSEMFQSPSFNKGFLVGSAFLTLPKRH